MPLVDNNHETWQDYLHGAGTVRKRTWTTMFNLADADN